MCTVLFDFWGKATCVLTWEWMPATRTTAPQAYAHTLSQLVMHAYATYARTLTCTLTQTHMHARTHERTH